MSSERVPDHVHEFLSRSVGSLDELALLVMLMASATRWWNAQAAGQVVGIGERKARRILERFAANNLLDIRISDDVRYAFHPGTPALESGAAEVLAVYRERPALIQRWASRLGGSGLSDFADAFSPTRWFIGVRVPVPIALRWQADGADDRCRLRCSDTRRIRRAVR
jgi:hypothetical protein